MKILLLLAALIQQAVAPAAASFDDFSVNQMMRLATRSPARLAEGRCAGFARWQLTAQPGAALPAVAFTATPLTIVPGEVTVEQRGLVTSGSDQVFLRGPLGLLAG